MWRLLASASLFALSPTHYVATTNALLVPHTDTTGRYGFPYRLPGPRVPTTGSYYTRRSTNIRREQAEIAANVGTNHAPP